MPARLRLKASFRILGKGFDPSVLCNIEAKRLSPESNRGVGVWSLPSINSDSEDIDDHVLPLVEILEPMKEQIVKLASRESLKAQFFVSVFATFSRDAFMSGRVIVSPETLRKISELKAELLLDLYSEDDEDI